MKRLLAGILLFFISLLSLHAQSSSTIQLRGMIPQRINISSTIAETTFIDLRVPQSMLLGSISLSANVASGYSVTITSQNRGFMRSTATDNPEGLPYSLSFGGLDSINLTDTYEMVFSQGSLAGTINFPVLVNFPGSEALADPISPGIYEDVVVITISVT